MIGADIGCAFVKIAFYNSDNEIETASIPSIISQGRGMIGSSGKVAITYSCEGIDFTVGQDASTQVFDTRTDSYPFSRENTVLMQHALIQAGFEGNQEVSTGITYGQFFSKDGINSDLIIKKKGSASLEVSNSHNIAPILVKASKVLPEGLAGAWGCSHDDEGKRIRNYNFGFLCVDIGGRTTDIVAGNPNFEVNPELSETMKLGYLDVFKELNKLLRENHKLGDINPQYLNKFYTDRFFEIGNEKVDIGDICDIAKRSVADRILHAIRRKLDQSTQVDEVIFIGGGSEDLRTELMGFERAYIPESPAFANARAYCIMGNLNG